jgi:hypothetical protein
MSSKKALMAAIERMELHLEFEQSKVTYHKNSLLNFWNENKSTFFALLVPAIMIGWRVSKRGRLLKLGKQITKFLFYTSIANFKRKFLVDISRSLSSSRK